MDNIGKNIQKYIKGAKHGDRESQFWLGFCYFHGPNGVDVNWTLGVKYMKLAAAQGSGKAAYHLGYSYESGMVGNKEKDMKKSKLWYSRAIEPLKQEGLKNNHDMESLACLGHAYLMGKGGLEENAKYAIKLIERAAKHGDPTALMLLAECYDNGCGVKEDPARAFALYQKAAEQGDVNAQDALGHMYLNGVEGGIVEKNVKKAIEIFQAAAAQKSGYKAKFSLGYCYQEGIGVQQDYKKAVVLYVQTISDGVGSDVANALNQLGYLYQNGLGVTKDLKRAATLYRESIRESSNNNNGSAESNLGYLYEHGMGVKKNLKMAVMFYHKASLFANKECPEDDEDSNLVHLVGKLKLKAHHQERRVLEALAYCYLNGAGVEKNEKIARALLQSISSPTQQKQEEQEKAEAKKDHTTYNNSMARKRLREEEVEHEEGDELAACCPNEELRKCMCCMDKPPSAILVHGDTGHAGLCFPCALSCSSNFTTGDKEEEDSNYDEEEECYLKEEDPFCPVCRASIDKVVLLCASASSSCPSPSCCDNCQNAKKKLKTSALSKDKEANKTTIKSSKQKQNTSSSCRSCNKTCAASTTTSTNGFMVTIVHGKTAHDSSDYYCSYDCAFLAQSKSLECPVCQEPIEGVIKCY